MRTKGIRFLAILALVALVGTSQAWGAQNSTFQDRWNAMVQGHRDRSDGELKAQEIFDELDSKVQQGSLLTLWRRLDSQDPEESLVAAWSIIRNHCPDGDVSQWENTGGLLIPQEIPRPLMVIDGFYTALMGLRRRPNGVWAAAKLLQAFVHSTRGRYYFLRTVPEPIATVITEVAAETGLVGLWEPETVVGRMPLARRVSGVVTDTGAVSRGMQFLDGDGIPKNNGFYAWDRRSGRIYRVISSNDRIRFRPHR